ncbi:MAG: glycosyltransferase family 4 protein, partial [Planctomycetaceae bacterium]
MKILLLNDAATPSGGAEILTMGLRDQFCERGHDARLFASSAVYGHGVADADYLCAGTTGSLRTVNRVANLSAYRKLRNVLSQFQPDVVHVRMFMTQLSPLILPLLKRVPSIYHATWNEVVCPTGLKMLPDGSLCGDQAGRVCYRNGCLSAKAWPLLMLQQRMFRHWESAFDRVVANSHAIKASLEHEGVTCDRVIYNGVPVGSRRPPLVDPPTIGYCGRLSSEKGVDVLVDAFAKVLKIQPNCQLLIVGDGDQREPIWQRVNDAGVAKHVTMLGQVNPSSVERLLNPVWVQAVPSKCREGFGLVAAEAMMRGTTVVASNAGGLAEVVDGGQTGSLVPPGD